MVLLEAFAGFELPMMDAEAIHRACLTLDSHIDIPWPHDQDPFQSTQRHVDLPKMRAGQLDAGCFVAYVPQGPCNLQGFRQARERAIAMLQTISGMGRSEANLSARVCATADAIESAKSEGVLAVVPAVENGHAIGDDFSALAHMRAFGAVYLTLTHNGHNALADSAIPRRDLGDPDELHGGLSGLGREAIIEMNRLGLLVDVSHLSRKSMLQAAMASRVPVVATHSCVSRICPHPRNLDDVQLDALRDSEGLIQITAMPYFLRPKGRIDGVGVADLVDHVVYVVDRCGLAHVGMSSDFDGGGGLKDWQDASQSGNVTAELVKRGFSAHEIGALWSGNFLRLMRRAEALAAST